MGERKVQCKYYPPDFDPTKIRRIKKGDQNPVKLRNMFPMKVRCLTCAQFIGEGTKCTTPKETLNGQTYLGIPIYRFYFKCTNCASEIIIRTDPQKDYTVESGARRCYEPERVDEQQDRELAGDVMNSLENRAKESKREMNVDAALGELKSFKSRRAAISPDVLLEKLYRSNELSEKQVLDEEEKEDEELIKSVFAERRKAHVVHKRCTSDEDDDEFTPLNKRRRGFEDLSNADSNVVRSNNAKVASNKPLIRVVPVIKDSAARNPKSSSGSGKQANSEHNCLQSLASQYQCDE